MVEGIKSDSDFNLYAHQEGLLNHEKSFKDMLPKLDETIINTTVKEYTSKEVIRVSEMELSGLMRWKKYIFVLTRYGYLHFFSSSDQLTLEGSICLSMSTLSLSEPTKNTFQIVYTPTGFFSSSKTYQIRALQESQMVDWLIDLKLFVKKHQY